MSIFREIPPTAGFAIRASELFSMARPGSLEEDFRNYLKVPYAAVTYSGTAACYYILEAVKLTSKKRTVVVPSFVCPLVPLAVARAGLKVEVCDIRPDGFDYNTEELEKICRDNGDILAVIAVHLAGIPVDLEAICAIARKYGALLIEDCAQALGADYKGSKVGLFGDYAFFSLCRGKGLTIYEGGVIIAREEENISNVKKVLTGMEKKNIFSEAVKITELFGYWIFYRPSLFWFVFKLPQLFWHKRHDPVRAMGEYASVSFPIYGVSGLRKSMGHAFFHNLEAEIEKRRDRAVRYFEGLEVIPGIRLIGEHSGSRAAYPYVVCIFDSGQKRDQALKALSKRGLGGSIVYVCALPDYAYLRAVVLALECPNGRYLAAHTLTLSTSPFLSDEDILCAIDCISAVQK